MGFAQEEKPGYSRASVLKSVADLVKDIEVGLLESTCKYSHQAVFIPKKRLIDAIQVN